MKLEFTAAAMEACRGYEKYIYNSPSAAPSGTAEELNPDSAATAALSIDDEYSH